ncbi:MAG: flagellar hook-basal body complex protein [Dehalococcoidia bacterium]|nr:flagellar hook-basal body complex protein [Dehalococcoidia bacterium]
MLSSLRVAATGVVAQQQAMDVTAHNLANVNSAGFKRSRVSFAELVNRPTADDPAAVLQLRGGVETQTIQRLSTQGPLQFTGNALDLAINGDAFFPVQLPDGGVGYTRDGTFRVLPNGQFVNASGLPLAADLPLPDGATNVRVSANGQVRALAADGQDVIVGQIALARFVNPGGLEAIGNNTYRATEASGAPIATQPGVGAANEIVSGALEASNVSIAEEMVNLILARRAYSANLKSIQTLDEMIQQTNQINR